jgi:uncharacterized protein (DUF849 family)
MSNEVIVTCAVTGAGDTVARSDKVPSASASRTIASPATARQILRLPPRP